MKTLTNHTLLYDEDCPMCNIYTSGFIKSKMLDSNGRKPFPRITATEQNYIDVERAKNEIALVDNLNQKVFYGIDGLLKVIGNSFPLVEKIGNIKPVNFILKKLYKFISYNRKVIVPSKVKTADIIHCVPQFNYQYRILYILFSILVSGFLLNKYLPEISYPKIIGLLSALILAQCLLLLKVATKNVVVYLGNFATSLLIGSLLLVVFLMVNTITTVSELLFEIYVYFIITIMVTDIIRRIRIIKFNLS
jgi:hypothetical protein